MRTIRAYGFQSVLELGSFDGDGSTQVLISALKGRRAPRLVCVESQKDRYKNLVDNTRAYPWVQTICQSTIGWNSFTARNFDNDVWNSEFNKLLFPYDQVRSWWDETIATLAGLDAGFLEVLNENFDAVLIDGGEFCGYDEFRLVASRAKCLMLDDVFKAYKNNRVHRELLDSPDWRLVWSDKTVRHGASIFVRSGVKPRIFGSLKLLFEKSVNRVLRR